MYRQRDDRATALRSKVRHFRSRAGPGIDLVPASAYEAVTRQMVEGLEEDLAEIKGRLNGLLWMMAGAIVVDILARVAGIAT
ncbi:MAG: hypothetical protein ACR2LS_06135 [Thermomicrobiales bacterium]